MIRRYINYILSGLVFLLATSCNLEEENINPDDPEDANVNLILPGAQAGLAYAQGSDLGRYANVFTQHLEGAGRQHLVIGQYQITEGDVDNLWRFNLYPAMENLQLVIQKAAEEGSPHYSGIAKVMLANTLGLTTDAWGDIPFSQAFQGAENLRPSYDTQEAIYGEIQRLLDEGIAELQAPTSFRSPGRDDLIYGGRLNLWVRAANTLKARYYNHLSQVDPMGSATQALAALQAGLASPAEDALFQFGTTETEANPYYQFNQQRGDVVMGDFFVNLLQSQDDPRLPFFVAEDGTSMGPFYGSINSPVPLVTYYEAKFIEAEAQLRAGSPDGAAAAFNEAVSASLQSVTGAADPAYVAAVASETGATITLQDIMTQKYIAMFTTIEPWVDYRRTGLPAIPVLQDALGPFPLRFPYPQSERLYNAANLPSNLNDTSDPVWWDR